MLRSLLSMLLYRTLQLLCSAGDRESCSLKDMAIVSRWTTPSGFLLQCLQTRPQWDLDSPPPPLPRSLCSPGVPLLLRPLVSPLHLLRQLLHLLLQLHHPSSLHLLRQLLHPSPLHLLRQLHHPSSLHLLRQLHHPSSLHLLRQLLHPSSLHLLLQLHHPSSLHLLRQLLHPSSLHLLRQLHHPSSLHLLRQLLHPSPLHLLRQLLHPSPLHLLRQLLHPSPLHLVLLLLHSFHPLVSSLLLLHHIVILLCSRPLLFWFGWVVYSRTCLLCLLNKTHHISVCETLLHIFVDTVRHWQKKNWSHFILGGLNYYVLA